MRILSAAMFFITVASVAFGGNAASLLARSPPRATRSLMLPSHPANQPKYSVIYNFPGYTLGQYPFGGENPVGGLLNVSGTLYGMTSGGGNLQGGTIYEATTTGAETVLSYVPYPQFPDTSLIDVAGTLYGTSPCGCAAGTVFSLTPVPNTIPTPTVLYNFGTTTNDGLAPQAPLIDVNGTFYGTTEWGGSGGPNCGTGVHGCGIVFSISSSGGYHVLHNFRGAPHDGSEPIGGLLDIGGTLYGTTSGGGRYGCGTVYAITRSGSERVLYSFKGQPDGNSPQAALIDVGGMLYGTTSSGGTGCSIVGCGTVFEVTPAGAESVIYSFGDAPDGRAPVASLLNVRGTLYGTTYFGGTSGTLGDGAGTVFSISPSGERVVHSFGIGSDGANPASGLVNVNGTLFGTTANGGTGQGTDCTPNCGTLYALKP